MYCRISDLLPCSSSLIAGPLDRRSAIIESAKMSSSSLSDVDRSAFPGLSDSQWSTLVSLFHSNASGSIDNVNGMHCFTWILDTGASFHMTGDRSLLVDLKDVNPSSVLLPDGLVATATQAGTLVLSDHLRLTDVLFVPRLKCNLISLITLLRLHN